MVYNIVVRTSIFVNVEHYVAMLAVFLFNENHRNCQFTCLASPGFEHLTMMHVIHVAIVEQFSIEQYIAMVTFFSLIKSIQS